ncbi:MAG: hypothetical protein ACFE95_02310 [Candidatus Hodarchaeota archaeon]
MLNDSTKEKPIVFTGDYYESIQCLLSDYVSLLKPNVIWIEYRVIPVLDLIRGLQIHPHLTNIIFFLQIPTIKALDLLLGSNELFSISQNDFSTIIIDFPKDFPLSNDIQVKLRELAKTLHILLLMPDNLLPKTGVELIQVGIT